MIETETAQIAPSWLWTLVEDVVLPAVAPLDEHVGHLAFRWHEPGDAGNVFDGWDVYVYPAPTEIRGGRHDGAMGVFEFAIELGDVVRHLQDVDTVLYRCQDGKPYVEIVATFARRAIRLNLLWMPPPDEPPVGTVDFKV